MTKEIVPITTTRMNDQEIETANARDLHEYLEVDTRFNDWWQRRIEEYGFEKNQDYVEFYSNLSKTPQGGRPTLEYHVTLDMAKELAMVERTEKGRMARRYFIECEKRLKAGRNTLPGSFYKSKLAPHENASKQFSMVLKTYKAMGLPTVKAIERAKKVLMDTVGIDMNALFPPEPLLTGEDGGGHANS